MSDSRPKVLIACDKNVLETYLPPEQIQRLEQLADWEWFECVGGGIYEIPDDPKKTEAIGSHLADKDALIVCHGAPRIDAQILSHAPRLKIIGELEGDRFAARIDLDAAWDRGVCTVDTTNGSSYPVAEWALGMILACLRNAGAHFRRLIAGHTQRDPDVVRLMGGMLQGKRVGLIGGGHMGRHLIKLLKPFEGEVWVHDPYLPRELAEAVGFVQTTLDNVFSQCDIIVCVAPLTPGTRGMIGARELGLLRAGSGFVNVSRGAVVDSDALIERLKKSDIVAGIEAFDPEPIPPDSELLRLDNVFVSPHFGWITGTDHPYFSSLMIDELERFFAGHDPYFELTPLAQASRMGTPPT